MPSLWPLIVLTDQDKYTLPIALALAAIGQNSTNYGLLMAGSESQSSRRSWSCSSSSSVASPNPLP